MNPEPSLLVTVLECENFSGRETWMGSPETYATHFVYVIILDIKVPTNQLQKDR